MHSREDWVPFVIHLMFRFTQHEKLFECRVNRGMNAWQRSGRCQQTGLGSALQHGLRGLRPFVIAQVGDFFLRERVVEDFAHVGGCELIGCKSIAIDEAMRVTSADTARLDFIA